MNARFRPAAVLSILLAVVVFARCKPPSGADTDLLIKVEWGAYGNEEVGWRGLVELDAGAVTSIQTYAFEEGDAFDRAKLGFLTSDGGHRTDGLLLSLRAPEDASIRVRTDRGVVTAPLRTLATGSAVNLELPGRTWIDLVRITPEEWDVALSHARDTRRFDAAPIEAYYAGIEAGRYNNVSAQETLIEASLARYETDPFFRRAEDARRGVNQQIYVTMPSVLAVGETFDITVAAFDLYGALVEDFRGPITLSVDGEGLELPPSIQLLPGERSILTVPDGGMALEPGYVRVVASDPSGRFASGAIPVRIEEEPVERVYWGSLHNHSNLSDGDFANVGPEDVYRFARDVGRLDFAALSDHDYRRPIPDWKWPMHVQAAAKFYDPGRFATLLGYEWSGEDLRFSEVMSHKNVYFRDATGPMYSAFDPRYNTPERLWAALRRFPGLGRTMTIPHHPVRRIETTVDEPWYGGAGTDWRFHDPELQPLVEVYSRWGSSEHTNGDNPRPVSDHAGTRGVQYALTLGYQLGMVADGDNHDGTPGVSVLPARQIINVYPTGLTAVFAPSLSREEVFDAIYARRCYGTSGSRRILMDLRTSDGVRAGETGEVVGTPTFDITVAGTTRLQQIELVRIDLRSIAVVRSASGDGWFTRARISDPDFADEGAYYLRVTQADDEMGWIGPIFLFAAE